MSAATLLVLENTAMVSGGHHDLSHARDVLCLVM